MARTTRPVARRRPNVDRQDIKGGQVQSLTRALSILKVLAESADGMSLSAVSYTHLTLPTNREV